MTDHAFCIMAPHPPIFVPAVGGDRARVTAASIDALGRCRRALAHYRAQTIVVISPHAPVVSDAFAIDDSALMSGTLSQFGDAQVHEFRGDPELAHAIAHELEQSGLPVVLRTQDSRLQAGWLDHATIVPLSFLDPQATSALVVLSLSYLGYATHRDLGAAVRGAARKLGRRTAFVASGDLSHRLTPDAPAGYSPSGAILDAAVVELISEGRFGGLDQIDPTTVEAGGECGLRSLISAGGYCGADPVPTRVLTYEGPWGVGYLTALAGAGALEADDATGTPISGHKGGVPGSVESEIVSLARSALVAWVRDGVHLGSPHLHGAEYPSRAGAFVSLHRHGELRGCIGTILPTRPTLAEEVAENAIQAATQDPRFPELTADELGDLDVKVDVLHPAEACEPDDLDPSVYGVIVQSGWRRGLLLPDLEGVDDVATQIAIAQRKAGIGPHEACSLERFKVDRYT